MSRAAAALFSAIVLALPAAQGQAVISAHSGMVNYVEGNVQLEGRPVKIDGAIFPDVKIGQTLSTKLGHAEVLLTPGVFLRLDNNATFRMASNRLTDTQVEILSGSALVEVDELLKDNRVAVKMGDSKTLLLKTGLYHFNADAGQVRTFEGKAQVSDASNSTELKGGRTLLVGSSLTPDKFNKKKSKGELYAWSEQRSAGLVRANISTARSYNSRGLGASMWAWNPYYSMYTFLPGAGRMYSPFGLSWYSPQTVWVIFQPAIDSGYQASGPSWQGSAPSSAVSVAPSSNASTGVVGASSGSSSAAVAASAGASRGR